MDPLTHGITGALLGKAYFSEQPGEEAGRVAVFAVTLGSVFPDVDVFIEFFSRDPLAIARYHRGFTHSFFGLPLFAAALALLTLWWQRRHGRASPSGWVLFAAYAAGIASHILLDGMTTFGTRLWNPFSRDRVAWDLLFIIDLTFTAIVLLPQVAAWIYRNTIHFRGRALRMWAAGSLATLGAWGLLRAVGFPFALWFVATASVLLAALFFLPARGGWGFGWTRGRWCRAGVYATFVYFLACGAAHHVALARVERFAAARGITVERAGALPLPPSLLDWAGLIRTPDGVYQSRFDLRDARAPVFQFEADAAPNRYIAAARKLPDVGTFLWFARFPTIHYAERSGYEFIDFSDQRFFRSGRGGPTPFTFRVILNEEGKLVEEGWTGAMTYPRTRKIRDIPEPASTPR
jgi:membrane-bound metal-dependent hydrolase YbcI (DUF457 family)